MHFQHYLCTRTTDPCSESVYSLSARIKSTKDKAGTPRVCRVGVCPYIVPLRVLLLHVLMLVVASFRFAHRLCFCFWLRRTYQVSRKDRWTTDSPSTTPPSTPSAVPDGWHEQWLAHRSLAFYRPPRSFLEDRRAHRGWSEGAQKADLRKTERRPKGRL